MTTYRRAGVDLDAADRHVARIAGPVTSTWDDRVVGGFGGFAAGVSLPPGLVDPILMMTTDGVGTKLELARQTGRWDGVGFDLVAMVVDDLAATGARPLGLVDYMAVGALDPDRDAVIVESIAAACQSAGCPLLGGETAEHPGVMPADQVDLAATALGVVERGRQLGPHRVEAGDVVIGLHSPNLRSNGFSLVRRVLENHPDPELTEQALQPSVIYSPSVIRATATGLIHAAAHTTGGGLEANLARVIPPGLTAELDHSSWAVPSIFSAISSIGEIPLEEMRRTFNMGIGFCLVVPAGKVDFVSSEVGHDARPIGTVVPG